ncbi:MAG: spermidine synthase [Burkholderiales bacterium]
MPLHSPASARALTLLFAFTLLVSACLLFWVQPLATKQLLPRFGGSPAVWTTASMFFQVLLLAGYCYAHALARTGSLRRQVLVHLAVLAGMALLALPMRIAADTGTGDDAIPALSLLWLLTAALGLPFFALASTAPLLQRWFSRLRHARAADPYFLYAASNLGSLGALIAFPLVLEPRYGLAQQNLAWSAGCALLVLLVGLCGVVGWRWRGAEGAPEMVPATAQPSAARWRERLRWIVLAFAPSSLLLGVTQYATAEIAAVPLLWLIPLFLYLLTFVLVFAARPPVPHAWMLRLQPWLVILLALVWTLNNHLPVLLVHLAVFFVSAMMCHGELARTRPPVTRLTEFYLCMAAGGALGGIFNALVAPLAFDALYEYPLVIALACLLRSPPAGAARLNAGDWLWPLALAAAYAALTLLNLRPYAHGGWVTGLYLEFLGVALYLCHRRPLRFGLMVGVVLLAAPFVHNPDTVLARERSFFGVHAVMRERTGKLHVLMHGITVHGAQYRNPEQRREPTTYYHRDSPVGQLFHVLERRPPAAMAIAAIGMGVGTIACYRRPGEDWAFFELDPVVVRLARDPRYFTFLADCAPDARIVTGDGRLTFAGEADGRYDAIVVDTFSSDAIPVHMLTREALALYLRKLKPDGVLIFHISNQYLDLAPVLATLAADAGVMALQPGPRMAFPPEDRFGAMESVWIVLARSGDPVRALIDEEGWTPLTALPRSRPWTDDYSNVPGALK